MSCCFWAELSKQNQLQKLKTHSSMDVKGRNCEFNKEADEEEDNIGGYEEEFLEYPCGEREEEEDAVVMVMNPSYYSDHDCSYEAGSAPKKKPGTTGPLMNSSIGPALRRNIQAW